MQALGQDVVFKKIVGFEAQQKLSEKVYEELQEYDNSDELGELADAYQALKDKAASAGIDFADIQKAQEQKLAKIGGFKNKIYVQTVTLEDNDPWIKYYAADPGRFPEITK
jgi:predicted house-cleaning noncanonical NTP pyrophosphatase (MazG superfamily)